MTSMLSGVQEFLTPSFLSRVSDETGESEAAVSKGFTAVVPALLGLIANRSSDTGFMSRLVSLAGNTTSDPDVLARSPRALRADDAGIDSGTGIGAWLSGLLPGGSGGLSAMTNSLSRFAGMRASSASSLLSIAGPLVLGYIGRMMKSDNLDMPKLAKRLEAERGTFAAALPAGFNPFQTSASIADADVIRTRDAVAPARPSTSWLWPLALIALLVAGLFWWNSRGQTPSPQAATGSTVRMLTRSLPGGIQLTVPEGSMEDRLIGYLSAPAGAGAFDFDRIEFETGSTSLRPQSRTQLANIARILSAYPQARVTIAGHTDNTGNEAENVALSQGRAEAVMNSLRENGAPAANLIARGLGSQNPVADNSTEAGRARNRRVTLSVAI
jgi:OmpA-OmpF porin, OOP family